MFSPFSIIRLLAWPVGAMGTVHAIFAFISFTVFHDHEEADFLFPACTLLLGAAILLLVSTRIDASRIRFRDALFFATLAWFAMGITGAIPIISVTKVSFTDGVFEALSALTTTGATVLSGLDHMPKTFLMYRQFLQWMGGLGIVIFVVAILPMLNVGGMKLLKAETPGPIKDEKFVPRMANATRYLWLIYLLITVGCAVSYALTGMPVFDAIAHSFTTVSTGGFSTHDASMGHFESHTILMVSNVFMLAGAINFALHFKVLHARAPRLYTSDEETRIFLLLVLGMTLVVSGILMANHFYQSPLETLSLALFHVISFITSTGFGAADFTHWPEATALLLVITGYFGGCAGSTAGGNKIIRNILTFKVLTLELRRLMHPRGVFTVHYQTRPVEKEVIYATMSFMFIAAFSTMILTILLTGTGLDLWSAFTAVAACLNVLGPAFGELGSNFQPVSDTGIWLLSVTMVLGRLEYFTLLALCSPVFWRR